MGRLRYLPNVVWLVSQNEPRIEQFIRRPEGHWVLKEAADRQSSLELPSLQITLSLAEVFANVNFEQIPLRPVPPPR
jgi:Uma2 family endonuclease